MSEVSARARRGGRGRVGGDAPLRTHRSVSPVISARSAAGMEPMMPQPAMYLRRTAREREARGRRAVRERVSGGARGVRTRVEVECGLTRRRRLGRLTTWCQGSPYCRTAALCSPCTRSSDRSSRGPFRSSFCSPRPRPTARRTRRGRRRGYRCAFLAVQGARSGWKVSTARRGGASACDRTVCGGGR